MRYYKSLFSVFVVGVVYILSMYYYKPYDAMYSQSEGDAAEYYVYLPACFIHHDLATLHTTMAAKLSHSRPGVEADSIYHDKYFMGTAVLQSPFFLVAHILAGLLHRPQDGFTMIYMYAVELSCLVYSMLGLFFIVLILSRQFSDNVSAIVVLIIGLVTNLYYLVVYQAPFSHPYLFFEYSLLIYFTQKFYALFQSWYILIIGMICGMIILTRMNEVYVVLIPLLWGIHDRESINERIKLFKKFSISIFTAGLLMLLCLMPQLTYWWISTGHFLYYSYNGERFDFLHPHIIGGLFAGSNGWLVYCPVMTLSLIGIWPVFRYKDASLVPILVFLSIHIYVIYSWWCWFYMGSYGYRPMTETYPLLSIPLAYSVRWFERTVCRKLALTGLCIFFSWIIIFQTYQTKLNIFNSELSNLRYNFITLGKSHITYDESVVLNTDEFQPDSPKFTKLLYETDFRDAAVNGPDTNYLFGHKALCLTDGEFSRGCDTSAADIGITPGQWIKASVNCLAKAETNHNWHLSSLVVSFTRNGKIIKWNMVGLQNKIDNPDHKIWHYMVNKWGRVYFYAQTPRDLLPTDRMQVFVWQNKKGPDIYIDDLKVELYCKR